MSNSSGYEQRVNSDDDVRVDDAKVEDSKISSGTVLHLVLALRGGRL